MFKLMGLQLGPWVLGHSLQEFHRELSGIKWGGTHEWSSDSVGPTVDSLTLLLQTLALTWNSPTLVCYDM